MAWFNGRAISDDASANGGAAVVTNVAFAGGVCRRILVGTGGTMDITFADGSVVTGVTLPAGIHAIACSKIVLGTATGVVALY